MHPGKKRIIGLLFLVSFIAYALSPSVCYTHGPVGNVPHIIFGKLAGPILTKSDGKNSGFELIVRKARTLIPEDSITKLTHLKNISISEKHFSPPSRQSSFSPRILTFARVGAEGFHFLTSDSHLLQFNPSSRNLYYCGAQYVWMPY